jgi:hypothetical protein
MAERDRAAVDVDPVLVDAEHADRVERDRGERLVDLPQSMSPAQAGLLERLAGGVGGRPWPGRRSRWRSARGRRSRPAPPCRWRGPLVEASTSAPPPSFTPGELPAVCEPSLPTSPGSFASFSSDVSRRGPSSISTTVSPLRPLIVTGTISSRAAPSSMACERQLVGAQRPAVQVGAGHLELVADLGRLDEHLLARERVGEAVVDHRVDRLRVAHAVAEARPGSR